MATLDSVIALLRSLAAADGSAPAPQRLAWMCYYAHGFHLALLDAPLFDAPLLAGAAGPALPHLATAPASAPPAPPALGPEARDLVQAVYSLFRPVPDAELHQLLALHPALRETPIGQPLAPDALRSAFAALAERGFDPRQPAR